MATPYGTKPPHRFARAQAASTLSVLAFLSPAVGLLVEIMLAWRFGASATVDAYRACAQILMLGSQLFFGQLLPNVVVPIFIEYKARGREHEGWTLAFTFGQILALCSLFLMLLTWMRPEFIVHVLAPGLTGVALEQAQFMVRYFVLAFAAMVWSGVISGILYAHNTFWVYPVGLVVNNSLLIISVGLAGKYWGAHSLVTGVLVGSSSMLALHIVFFIRLARRAGVRVQDFFHIGPLEGLRKAFWISMPLIGMIAFGQWGDIVSQRALSCMPPGTLSSFGYAFKLLLLVGILPTSLATVLFPSLTEAQTRNDVEAWRRLASRAIRMTLFISVSLTSLFFVLRGPVISLLLQRGAMDESSMQTIYSLFAFLLIGAPASALMSLLYKFSYAQQDPRSPAAISVLSTLVTVLMVPWAAQRGGAVGVAIAYGAVIWLCAGVLLAYQSLHYHVLETKGITLFLLKLGVMLVFILGVGGIGDRFLNILHGSSKPWLVAQILLTGSLASAGAYGICQLLHIQEFKESREYLVWQILKFLPGKEFLTRSR
jgi:putative peptidoglycan lipid II flippase